MFLAVGTIPFGGFIGLFLLRGFEGYSTPLSPSRACAEASANSSSLGLGASASAFARVASVCCEKSGLAFSMSDILS